MADARLEVLAGHLLSSAGTAAPATAAPTTATVGGVKPVKVYISADIEGVGGVVNEQHLGAGGLEYTEARTWMTLEVIAARAVSLSAGSPGHPSRLSCCPACAKVRCGVQPNDSIGIGQVVAAAEAALAAGATLVLISDSHGNGLNIMPDMLPTGCRLVRSWPRKGACASL